MKEKKLCAHQDCQWCLLPPPQGGNGYDSVKETGMHLFLRPWNESYSNPNWCRLFLGTGGFFFLVLESAIKKLKFYETDPKPKYFWGIIYLDHDFCFYFFSCPTGNIYFLLLVFKIFNCNVN